MSEPLTGASVDVGQVMTDPIQHELAGMNAEFQRRLNQYPRESELNVLTDFLFDQIAEIRVAIKRQGAKT